MNTIKYNRALEFICSMIKYCRQKNLYVNWHKGELKEDPAKGILDFNPDIKIKQWLSYVDNNISPYFRNDFLFINTEILGFLDVCFLTVLEKNLSEPQELIDSIKNLDENLLIESLFGYYDVDVSFAKDDKRLLEELIKSNSEKISRNFLHIKNNPSEYKNKAVDCLEEFYDLYYAPFESDVCKSMKTHLEKHNNLFVENPVNFVNLIGSGDYSSRVKDVEDIDLYVSYYIDYGMFYYNIGNRIIMCYGKQ